MRVFNYLLSILEDKYKAPKFFFDSSFPIVDNEIANDISDDWDYEKGEIIVTGFLEGRNMTIFVKESVVDQNFKNVLSDRLKDYAGKLFAFNNNMERGNFKGDLGQDVVINEIKPFNGRGWSKDRFYLELIKRKVIPPVEIVDIFGGDASMCPVNWSKYLNDNNFKHLSEIVEHNINCLLKESVILQHKFYWNDHVILDKNNFIIGWKEEE